MGDPLGILALVIEAGKAAGKARQFGPARAWQSAITYVLETPEFSGCTRRDLDSIRVQEDVRAAAQEFRRTGVPDYLRKALEAALAHRPIPAEKVAEAADILLERMRIAATNDPALADLVTERIGGLGTQLEGLSAQLAAAREGLAPTESAAHSPTTDGPAGAPPGSPVAGEADNPVVNLPLVRNSYFTGRKVVLQRLRRSLSARGKAALAQATAISGFGGIGKTQTALEYAYEYVPQYPTAVLWVTAESYDALSADLTVTADLLGIPVEEGAGKLLAPGQVRDWLSARAGWLLVFDNADDPGVVGEFLPANRNGHVLITSRAQVFQEVGISRPIALDVMTRTEASEFLLKRTGRSEIASPREKTLVPNC
jgi:hypothetical protein